MGRHREEWGGEARGGEWTVATLLADAVMKWDGGRGTPSLWLAGTGGRGHITSWEEGYWREGLGGRGGAAACVQSLMLRPRTW